MKPDSSGSPIDRVVAWLRGLFAAGKSATDTAARDARRATQHATDTARERVDGAERKVHDLAGDRGQQGLPNLADEPSDDEIDRRSDFDDAAGDLVTGEETYPPAGTDLGAATRVHDAVGGEDERADDATDGTIDATRDADVRPGGTEGYQDREVPLQDEIIVDEGASSDEFDGDEVTPGDADNPYVTRDDVEKAAEGYGDRENTDLTTTSDEGTTTLTGSTFTQTDVDVPPAADEDTSGQPPQDDQDDTDSGAFEVVEHYNYGMGDLGVGAGAAPDDASTTATGPSETDTAGGDSGDASDAVDASVSPEATRTEIESQSREDAVNRSDEATQTPGFGAPETFDSAAAGTTEPSRSATGNVLGDEQDALGTTLDHSAESDPFDDDAANLSDEDELTVSDENIVDETEGFGDVERVATFQSGTIAREGLSGGDTTIDDEVTAEAYADLPGEPEPATADDAGEDDFSGSDYPSDRRVDPLDGDDFADAEVPDVDDLDSSAGDLETAPGDAPAPAGDTVERLDQDLVGTSDEHVGGEEPAFAEVASHGTDETGFDDLSPAAHAVDEAIAASEGTGAETAEDLTSSGAPAGAVRGDGTTGTPEGYPIKGNASSMIYHLPNFPSYTSTKAEFCFATEQDAINAGYRAPGKRNRGKSS